MPMYALRSTWIVWGASVVGGGVCGVGGALVEVGRPVVESGG
jgi:hypothetical protein